MYTKALTLTILFLNVADPVSVYYTPNLYDQFTKFIITNLIPSNGTGTASPTQSSVSLDSSSVIFEFKGVGNALLLFQKDDSANDYPDVFMVRLGGNMDNARIGIHVSKTTGASDEVASTDVSGLTSPLEFRSFWVSWNVSDGSVLIGTGANLDENVLLSRTNVFTFNVSALSISTDANNAGEWRFQTDTSTSIAITTLTTTPSVGISTHVTITITSTTPFPTEVLSTSSSTDVVSSSSSLLTGSPPSRQDLRKSLFDKPENIAAVAVPVSVSGLSLALIAGYTGCKSKSTATNSN